MRASRLLETVLYARDLAAARRFYTGVLGLAVHDEAPGRFVFFRMADQMLLIFNPERTVAQALASGPPPHGATGAGHLCFRSIPSDLERWRQHLLAQGVAIEKEIDWPGGGHSIYFRDPAGNSLEVADGALWSLPERRTLAHETIVIATHNLGKIAEFASLLAPFGAETLSAAELGLPVPAETEKSFKGNARIKAEAAMAASGRIALADDSGLCVEALGGEPGVFTADWAGPERDWNRAMHQVEDRLRAQGAVTPGARRAAFVCTLCLAFPDGELRYFEGRAMGHLTWPPRGTLGHGYDPMFVPDGLSRTFAELDPAEKNRLSHRAQALEHLTRELF